MADRVLETLSQTSPWETQILQREERFVRVNLIQNDIFLKIGFINDVPSRVGLPRRHPNLGLLDSAKNILANKITALLGRDESKDKADNWGLCCRMNLSLE